MVVGGKKQPVAKRAVLARVRVEPRRRAEEKAASTYCKLACCDQPPPPELKVQIVADRPVHVDLHRPKRERGGGGGGGGGAAARGGHASTARPSLPTSQRREDVSRPRAGGRVVLHG